MELSFSEGERTLCNVEIVQNFHIQVCLNYFFLRIRAVPSVE